MKAQRNVSSRFGAPLAPADRAMFGPEVMDEVRTYMAPLGYASTPMHSMSSLARHARVGQILVKDERTRSTLGSFKALGGAYAVVREVLALAERALARRLSPDEINDRDVRAFAADLTITCATDGNHGRAVASGARLMGCSAVIFVHEHVSTARIQAIRELGASVTVVAGSYEDSVAAAKHAAAEKGWLLVADTSWPGYEALPARVMQGYVLMVHEALQQCETQALQPTHVFLQAGVGGMAAAVAAYLRIRFGESAVKVIIVEPERAACLYASACNGALTRIEAGDSTVMAMLECYEPSLVAWRILERCAHTFIAIEEEAAVRTLRRLARPLAGDPAVESGESGGAGLAGLLEVVAQPELRRALSLGDKSVVLVFNTEGATDRARYEALLGKEREAK